VLSTIKHFREEYEEQLKYKYCRAGVCGDLFLSPCENACPAKVNVPGYLALVAAGRIKDAYDLIRQENRLPAVVPEGLHPSLRVCSAGVGRWDEPVAICDLKRYVAARVL